MTLPLKKQRVLGLSQEEAKAKLARETFTRIPVSFYRYVKIADPKEMKNRLLAVWKNLDCLGRVYIAHEGINAQMSIPEYSWEAFKDELYDFPEFTKVPLKIGIAEGKAFIKLKVKIRKQIVADGLTMDDYDIENVGKHLSAKEFNEAMDDTSAIVVDMRNHYESEIGYFENALLPKSDTFRQELPLVVQELKGNEDKKILLYCTGGIRCEKASAYLRHQGFKDVNQLHGGIIDYKHQIERESLPNKFKGSNFVFDERGREAISSEIISHCHQCDALCDRHVNCQNRCCNLLFLQCADCEQKMHMTCSAACKKIMLLSPTQRASYYQTRLRKSSLIFSKSIKARKSIHRVSHWQKFFKIFA